MRSGFLQSYTFQSIIFTPFQVETKGKIRKIKYITKTHCEGYENFHYDNSHGEKDTEHVKEKDESSNKNKEDAQNPEERKTVIKHLMLLHFQNKVIIFILKNMLYFDVKND